MSWDVLVVDDEPNIQEVTALALSRLVFEKHSLRLHFASSAESAIEKIKAIPGVAVILLDVVMEHETSGLDLISYVRNSLKNPYVRFILRTGQAGAAPESQIIQDYDIQEYWNKVDLTVKRLRNTVISALRSYASLIRSERRRKVSEFILHQCGKLHAEGVDERQFIDLICESLTGLLPKTQDLMPTETDFADRFSILSMRASGENGGGPRIMCAGGEFENWLGVALDSLPDPEIRAVLNGMIAGEQPIVLKEEEGLLQLLLRFEASGAAPAYIFVQGPAGAIDANYLTTLAAHAQAIFRNRSMHWETRRSYAESAAKVAAIVEMKLGGDDSHLRRIPRKVRLLALRAGCDAQEADLLAQAAALHDIGKIKIADSILMKPGPLTPEEWSVIRTSPSLGHELLAASPHEALRAAALIALEHNEHWNGAGYPAGKTGSEISLGARLTSIIVAHDRLLCDRPYRKGWRRDEAFAHMKQGSGSQFDPDLIRCFIDAYDDIVAVFQDTPPNACL